MTNLKLIVKPTDYGAYREILKRGNKILGWLEQRPKTNLEESETYFYTFGKPSQTSYCSFGCKTLEEAREKLIKYSEGE